MLLVSVTSCIYLEYTRLTYKDVSQLNELEVLMNGKFEAKTPIRWYGVTDSRDGPKVIDWYNFKFGTMGYSGREILDQGFLPVGSIVKIIGAKRCINCLFEEERQEFRFQIEVEDFDTFGLPTMLREHFYGPEQEKITVIENGKVKFDPKLLVPVE